VVMVEQRGVGLGKIRERMREFIRRVQF
jgi:hypothetical protein